MPQPNELRVFISSTFRDLQEEREHLIKKIFPEIRSLCRERGITFTEVDLRWGLTEEEATLGRIIRTCLEEVDKCRPYFIGMIGSRYGWVPDLHEVLIDPDLMAKYPWVEEAALDGTSLTEMEFIHGVFNAVDRASDYSYFYHRSQQTGQEDDPEKLRTLIERVKGGGYPLQEFTDAETLGLLVHDDLLGMIDRYWPEHEAPSALEIERRAHAAFSASRRRAYIPNPRHLKEFNQWLADGTTPLVVSAESGLGKSALAAYLTESYRMKHPTAVVIEYYVGSSEQSGSALSLVRHVVEEIRDRYAISEELPPDSQKLLAEFPNWLWRLGHLAAQQGEEVLIVLDALNQLDEGGQRLTWLPPIVSQNLKLLVTVTPGDALDTLRRRGWWDIELVPIEEERMRQSIVLRYLGEFHKGIATEQLRRITSDAKGSSPLYLRVVAEELRLHGEHETLDALIERYVQAEDLLGVFEVMLERIEHDYGAVPVGDLLRAIWVSRSGLTELEMMEITRMSRLELSRLLFAIDYHFVHRDGVLGFFHDYLRRAVEQRYLSDVSRRKQVRLELARYFEGVTLTQRTALELLWQYGSDDDADTTTEQDEHLASTLARPDVSVMLYRGEMRFEMLTRWRQLVQRGYNPEQQYRQSLAADTGESGGNRGEVLAATALLLKLMGRWAAAEELYGELVVWSREQHQPADEVTGHLGLGGSMEFRGEYTGAMEHFEEALRLASDLGDRRGMSKAIGNIGTVHADQGRYVEALEYYGRCRAISEELGDHRTMSMAIGHMGNVHVMQGRYAEALECYDQWLVMSEELGDRRGMSKAIGNIGAVHREQGRYMEALECYGRLFAISEDLGDPGDMAIALEGMGLVYLYQGRYSEALECLDRDLKMREDLSDRSGMASAIGNIGTLHEEQGRYMEALECYNHLLAISEELGDPRMMAIAIGNMGNVYRTLGQYDRALDCFARASKEHRAIGFHVTLTDWLKGTAETLLTVMDVMAGEMPEYLHTYLPDVTVGTWQAISLRRAREQAEECVAISEELSKPDTLFSGRVLLARIEAAEGSADAAVAALRGLLAEAGDDDQRAESHYWLWKLLPTPSPATGRGGEGPGRDHRTEALRLYQSLFEKSPKHVYRQRIEDLSANEPSTSESDHATA